MWELFLFIIALVLILMRRMSIPLLIIFGFYNSFTFTGAAGSEFLFVHNYVDVANVLMAIMLLTLMLVRHHNPIKQLKTVKRGAVIFVVFFVIAAIVDIWINHDKIGSVARVFRMWVPIGMVFCVGYFKPIEIKKLVEYIVALSVLLSALIIFQQLTSIEILSLYKVNELSSRSPIPWILSLFVVLLLLNDYYKSPWKKWLSIGIILLNILMSGSRSLSIAYFLVILVSFLFSGRFSYRKLAGISVLFIAIVILFSTDNILSRRMEEAADERSNIASGKVEGTFSMRMLMLYERMDYIDRKLQYQVLGIGFIQEKDFPSSVFIIGLRSSWDGPVSQVDSGDIAWSPLFLRFGYVGTALLVLFFYIPLIRMYWKRRKNKLFFSIAFYLFVNLMLISFTYSYIYEGSFFLLPILLSVFIPIYDEDYRLMNIRVVPQPTSENVALIDNSYDS